MQSNCQRTRIGVNNSARSKTATTACELGQDLRRLAVGAFIGEPNTMFTRSLVCAPHRQRESNRYRVYQPTQSAVNLWYLFCQID